MTRTALALAALLALACASCSAGECSAPLPCSAQVAGACIVTENVADAIDPVSFAASAERAIQVGAGFWGVAPDVLTGWTIVPHWRVSGGACPPDSAACCDLGCGVIHLSPSPCFESSLVHEMGHVVLGGDAEHRDPRWEHVPHGRCYSAPSTS